MPKIESRVPPPAVLDGPGLADWAEAALLIEGRRHLSRARLRHRLKSLLFIEGAELETEVDLLLSEVSRRDRIASGAYPFREESAGLSRNENVDEAPYEFLLLLSVSNHYREEKQFGEGGRLFDELVKEALAQYLGSGARAIRFAHPSSDGRPPGFPEAVRWLAGLLNLGVGSGEPRPQRKDGGVDVVAWRPFRDGLAGFIVVLCQCTIRLDWIPKARDIVGDVWRGWIDLGRDPVTALAIPLALGPSFRQWDELRRTVTMVLDRLRLCELGPSESWEYLEEVRAWVAAERGHLGVVLGQ